MENTNQHVQQEKHWLKNSLQMKLFEMRMISIRTKTAKSPIKII